MKKDKKYREFNSREEADSWIVELNTKFGYPNGVTTSYSSVDENTGNGKFYVVCCSECQSELTAEEIAALKPIKEVVFPQPDWVD